MVFNFSPHHGYLNPLLGSKFNKSFKIMIKTSNIVEYIQSDIQNIKALRTNDPII